MMNRCDGLEVRACASRSGGCGFEPRPGHTKDFKNFTFCLLVRCSAFKEWRMEVEPVELPVDLPLTVAFTALGRRVA